MNIIDQINKLKRVVCTSINKLNKKYIKHKELFHNSLSMFLSINKKT